MNFRSSQSLPNVGVRNVPMYRFHCGHEQCGSQIIAPTRDSLRLLIAKHLKEAHSVDKVTTTLMSYLESTCVTVLPLEGASCPGYVPRPVGPVTTTSSESHIITF